MMRARASRLIGLATLAGVLAMLAACPASAQLILGPEEFVQADGTDIAVPSYSVPSFVHWDGDGLKDLVVGEGGGVNPGKVRVYPNVGSAAAPQFTAWFYAQSDGLDLTVPASGCQGAAPRTVDWDGDGRKDLLVGRADGTVALYLNTGTDAAPAFDGGTLLQVGLPAAKVNIDVGMRANPTPVDWNNDGRKDLVVGALDAKIHVFLNEGTDAAPDFHAETFAQAGAGDLVVLFGRSSPVVMDLDGDGKKDLLSGNTNGQLLFYSNVGTDAAPSFGPFEFVESDGVAIDLPGTPRSRPFVCDWTGDGLLDVLVGSGDGKVRLYQGVAEGEPPVAALQVVVDTPAGPVELAGGERVNTGSLMGFSDESTGEPPLDSTLALNGLPLGFGWHDVGSPDAPFQLGGNLAALTCTNEFGEDQAELGFEVILAPHAKLVLMVNGVPFEPEGLHVLMPGDEVELNGTRSEGTVEVWAFRKGQLLLVLGSDLGLARYRFVAGQDHAGAFDLSFQVMNTGLGNNSDLVTASFVLVPEPATLVLLAAGVVGLAARRRRRR